MNVGTALPAVLKPSMQIKFAGFLEALGFDQVWLPDHLLFPENAPAYDPWVVMGALAMKTKRIQFGPAVTDPHRTHPAVMAQRIATLDQMSRGRVILGLGSGEAMNLDPYGLEWRERKVGKMKEYITVVRGLLDSKEPFTFEGDFYQLKRARLRVRPFRERRIPIYMAALGPMMQRLAGRLADGWLPAVLPPEHFAEYYQPMADSAVKHGRDPESLARVATMVASIDTDGTTSRAEITEWLRPISGALVWAPVFERLGIELNPPENARISYPEVNPCDPESLERYWNLQRWMPAEMLDYAVAFGAVEDMVTRALAYKEAGATHLQTYFASFDPLGAKILFAHRALPSLTGRRPTPLAALLGTLLGPLIRRGVLRRRFPAPKMRMPEARPDPASGDSGQG